MEIPDVEIELEALWNYELVYGIQYDWKAEWFYGWDLQDSLLYGTIGYTEPSNFNVRLYHTGQIPYQHHTTVDRRTISGNHLQMSFNWGFWDILIWNNINTIDGVQSLVFDEDASLDYVTAHTNQTMHPSRYNAPKYTHSFYEPEALFAAYEQAIEISQDMKGFEYDPERNIYVKTLNLRLEPLTYIYLTQIILHHNNGRISGVDGNANLSSMARSVNLNTGVAGPDPITVNYNVRFKNNCDMHGEKVDIAGGRLMTFGRCNINANRITRASDLDDSERHYLDLTMQFNSGVDSTFVFDVTDQVNRLFKGGVLTIELDMDTIPVPRRTGGSGFDAVVKDFEDGGTHEFDM